MKQLLQLVLIVCLILRIECSVDYSNHALFHANIEDDSVFNYILDKFDVWGKDQNGFHIFGEKAILEKLFSEYNVEYNLLSDQIEQEIQKERQLIQSSQSRELDWFEDYHNYTETREWYRDLSFAYPRITTFVESIGKTWESRDIFAFHITAANNITIPKIWIQCNIHAREWITGATCQFIVNEILTKYGSDDEITSLVNNAEFIFIPIVNPDGYEYTWKTDRMWRKNRRSNGSSYGVDLNRNFDAQWGGVGSSPTPSSDTYRGPSAESEPETKAIADYYTSLTTIVGAIDMHSYSQYVLRPYTHVNTAPKDESLMKQVTDEMVTIIKSVHGETYVAGRWYSTLYASSGVAQDYFYSKGAYGITIELRPKTSIPGFILPPDEIIPTGEEITPAVVHFAKFCVDNPLF